MSFLKVVHHFQSRLYWQFVLYAYSKPILLSLWFLAVYFFIIKIYFNYIAWWHVFVAIASLCVAGYFGFKRFQEIRFSDGELAALIDKKLEAGGTYMVFDENGGKQSSVLQKVWISKFADIRKIESNRLGSYLSQFFLLLLFTMLVLFVPFSLNRPWLNSSQKDVFVKEKEDLNFLENLKAFDPNLLDVMQKELSDLSKEYEKNGLNKQLWDKKSALNKMIEKTIEDQLLLEQQQIERLSKIVNDISAGQEVGSLLDSLAKLDKEMMQKNKSPDGGQAEMKDLLEKASEFANDPKNKDLMDKLMQNFGDLQKKLEGQNKQSAKALELNPGNIKEAKIAKDAAEKLRELAEKLEAIEGDLECEECEGGFEIKLVEGGASDGGISRGPGSSEIKFSNPNEDKSNSGTKETVEVSQYFNARGEVLDSQEGTKHQDAIFDKEKGVAIEFVDTKTDLIFNESLKPHRRKVIREYFNTPNK